MTRHLETLYSIDRFEAADVDPAIFDHEAHIYVGWLYAKAFPRDEAVARFDAALRRLTAKIGATGKYNAMITWLFLLLIDERTQEGEDWLAFRTRNDDLFENRPRLNAARGRPRTALRSARPY
jgi:hypothetical protein